MKYHWIKQQSGEDCGAASLTIVAQHYGFPIKINRMRALVGTGRSGTTLLGLKQGAEAIGFQAHALKGDDTLLDHLDDLPLPAILYWDGYHFTVLYGKETDAIGTEKYVIADPAMAVRHLTKEEVLKHWQGRVMLILEPDPAKFGKRTDLVERSSVLKAVMHRLMPQKSLLLRLVVLNLFLGILSLAAPLLMQVLTDHILIKQEAQFLAVIAIGGITLYAVNSLFSLAQSRLIARFSERLQASLKSDFGKQILRLPLTYHEGRRSNTIMSRLGDIQSINYFISQVVITVPSQLFVALISIAVILFYSWKLALVSIGMGTVMILITQLLQPRLQQSTYRAFEATGNTYANPRSVIQRRRNRQKHRRRTPAMGRAERATAPRNYL